MTRDDWRSWLALRMVRGIGPVVYQDLLRAFGSPAAVLETGLHARARFAGSDPPMLLNGKRKGSWEGAKSRVKPAFSGAEWRL